MVIESSQTGSARTPAAVQGQPTSHEFRFLRGGPVFGRASNAAGPNVFANLGSAEAARFSLA
jgi:hypothetical protein